MALTTGLIATYNLDGSYNNELGTGYNGVLTGSVPFVSGKIGQGVSFSGSGTTNNINIGTPIIAGAGTVCGWFYPTLATGLQVAFGDSSLWKGIVFNYLVDGTVTAYAYTTSARFVRTSITFNQWVHVAMTWNSVVLKLYVNGVYINQDSCVALFNTGNDVHIGPPPTRTFNGNIDMFNVFNIEKTQLEIQQLMKKQYPFLNNKFFTLL